MAVTSILSAVVPSVDRGLLIVPQESSFSKIGPDISVIAIAAMSSAFTAVFSDDANWLMTALSAVVGVGIVVRLVPPSNCTGLPPLLLFGDSSDEDVNNGNDPDSDLSPEKVRLGFSTAGEPCFKKAFEFQQMKRKRIG